MQISLSSIYSYYIPSVSVGFTALTEYSLTTPFCLQLTKAAFPFVVCVCAKRFCRILYVYYFACNHDVCAHVNLSLSLLLKFTWTHAYSNTAWKPVSINTTHHHRLCNRNAVMCTPLQMGWKGLIPFICYYTYTIIILYYKGKEWSKQHLAIDTLTLKCFHLSRDKVCLSQANTRAYAVPNEEPRMGIHYQY